MTSDFIKVDDADIEALLSHEARTRAFEAKREWIEFEKLRFAIQFKLAKFFMNQVQFIAIFYQDGVFIRQANSYAPCGFFSYVNVE